MVAAKISTLFLLAVAAGACASRSATGGPGEAAPRPVPVIRADPASDLSAMLSGTFSGAGEGNDLTLTITGAGMDRGTQTSRFSVAISGRYRGDEVQQSGTLRLENQGTQALIAYSPRRGPAEDSSDSACSVFLGPSGDGYAGRTTETCPQAGGGDGRWILEVDPGSIQLRNAQSGETLRFRRVTR